MCESRFLSVCLVEAGVGYHDRPPWVKSSEVPLYRKAILIRQSSLTLLLLGFL
jgi:hypothetical protein